MTKKIAAALLVLALGACSGHLQLGGDQNGIGVNGKTTLDERGLQMGAGGGAHVLGHGFDVGTKAAVQ